MATNPKSGKKSSDDSDFVEPLEPSVIDPLSLTPAASATSPVSVSESKGTPKPSTESPYDALLEADRKKRVKKVRKTAQVDAVTTTPQEVNDDGEVIAHEVSIGAVKDPVTNETVLPMPAADASYHPESSEMLTDDRLLNEFAKEQPVPEGWWQRFVYEVTFHKKNLGDAPKIAAQKQLTARIARDLEGKTRFVPVLTRKGGVGKTTVTTLLGMALATARDDRTLAIDANPDRGTLADRVSAASKSTIRDLARNAKSINGYADISNYMARDETRLDVLSSSSDPMVTEPFSAQDYRQVAGLVQKNYSIALTDCGTGITDPVMNPILKLADSLVIVAGSSVDEARLASETLTWLEKNGYEKLVRRAVVVINLASQGSHMVRVEELDVHFGSRVRSIIRVPYDKRLAAGSVITWDRIDNETREAARQIAAAVVDSLSDDR